MIKWKRWSCSWSSVTPGKRWGRAYFWRCARLPQLLLQQPTCSPSLWPFSILTAAAIFSLLLFPSHIRSNMVSSSHTEYSRIDLRCFSVHCLCDLGASQEMSRGGGETLKCKIFNSTKYIHIYIHVYEMWKVSEALLLFIKTWCDFEETVFWVLSQWCLKGLIQGVVWPPKWRKLCSCFKLVLRESLGRSF